MLPHTNICISFVSVLLSVKQKDEKKSLNLPTFQLPVGQRILPLACPFSTQSSIYIFDCSALKDNCAYGSGLSGMERHSLKASP